MRLCDVIREQRYLSPCCGEIQLKLVFKENIECEQKLGRKLPSGKVWLDIAGRTAWLYSMSRLMERFWWHPSQNGQAGN